MSQAEKSQRGLQRPAPTSDAAPQEPAPQYPLPPSLLDAEVYTDRGRFEKEIRRIFLRSWFPVFPASDLARPRDFLVWDQLRQSVVIVRQDDGSLAAWHNVCQHRGSRIVGKSGHCDGGRFKCPWHGFVYDLTGSVATVPLRESFDAQEIKGLRAPSVRASEWSGYVWLCFSEDAPPLREYLGAIWDELEYYRMERFQTRFRTRVNLKANWKLVVDAFNETWHVPFTHQDTLSRMVLWRDARLRITPPHSWMTLPIRDFTEKRAATDHRESHVCHYLAFPNSIFSCFPTHLQMWSAWPVSISETILNAWGIVGPAPAGVSEEKWASQNERDWDHFVNVLKEDTAVINGWGTVANSLGFRRCMFNTAESRLTAFHAEVGKRIR
jgi:phenylpropionate dioxygenase-like ring-hydroxylating dioxygenase large terminal subunit